MRRRKVLKTLIVGGAAAAMIHPTSRKKVIKFGKMSVDVYKRTCISLSEKKKVSPKNMAELRPFFNFSSKKKNKNLKEKFLRIFKVDEKKKKHFYLIKLLVKKCKSKF